MSKCKCTLRESAVGDGCRYCNPQDLIDNLADERDEQEEEIERLQSRIKELEADRDSWRRVAERLEREKLETEAENAELRAEVYCNQMCVRFWPSHHSNCRLLAIRLNRIKQQADDEGEA